MSFVAMAFLLFACVKDRNFDSPSSTCVSNLEANSTYAKVRALYQGETLQIQEDLIIEGYVVSSDAAGNFFSVLHFQDEPSNPSAGFQIEIDMRDSHLFYPVRSKILIKLKGLYLGKSKDVFKLGGVFTSFGNVSVGRLPNTVLDEHIFVSCDVVNTLQPTMVSIESLRESFTNTLVQFNDLEIKEDELSEPFALEREETERTLTDCTDNELVLLNSGFSDFQAETMPQGNGSITGVLLRERDDYFLAIRSLEDIDFTNERCEDLVNEFTSTSIFISELSDPNNNLGARFVELFNAADAPLSLNGWQLRRYTNANTEVSSIVDLSELTIAAQSAIVIAANAEEFENVYGFTPDLEASGNTAANSNGDDNLELVDPFGTTIDIFGVIGEDGSNTNHEFEDGRALRKPSIIRGNSIYTFNEWFIYNDSGNFGTTNQPQNAPEDFTPGVRN